MTTYQKLFQLKSFDGVLHGTSLRRIPALHGVRYGLLVLWQRSDHSSYMAYEVDPSKGVTINDLSKTKWESTSFLMYYALPRPSEPFLDEFRQPNIDDLSNIEPAPESVIDVDRELQDMISLIPDLDDWITATEGLSRDKTMLDVTQPIVEQPMEVDQARQESRSGGSSCTGS